MSELQKTANEIRKRLIKAHSAGNASHIGTSFSALDIIVTLYEAVMNIDPNDANAYERDRFILSKGHGVSAVYGTLTHKKLIPDTWLDNYFQDGSMLSGHPDRLTVPYLEASSGSLGHGLPIALGRAYALNMDNNPARVFVVMSDGEMQEGSNWEAANNAARLGLDNLTVIIDANKWQSYDRTDAIMPISTFRTKWASFGWSVTEVDGHDHEQMKNVFSGLPLSKSKPSAIIAHTVKGKGVKEFEDKLGYHYWSPKPENVDAYLRELDA